MQKNIQTLTTKWNAIDLLDIARNLTIESIEHHVYKIKWHFNHHGSVLVIVVSFK